MKRLPFLVRILPALLLLALPFTAIDSTAGPRQGGPWPGSKILYYNATGWKVAVPAAASAWNRTGLAPRLVATSDRNRAQVIVVARTTAYIRRHCPRRQPTCIAFTKVGYQPTLTQVVVRTLDRPDDGANEFIKRTVVHEFGHVLGLSHPSGHGHACEIMRSDAPMSTECSVSAQEYRRLGSCGPYRVDQINLARFYGRPLPRSYRLVLC